MEKTYKQLWYEKNKEKAIEYTKQWQKENKEKVNKKNREWAKKNPDKVKKTKLHWRKKYPEKHKAYIKKWNATILKRRREYKNKLREESGNKCSQCGYSEEPRILQFHHVTDNKLFTLGAYRRYSLEKLKKEAEKCVLLCPNCHFKLHLPKNYDDDKD